MRKNRFFHHLNGIGEKILAFFRGLNPLAPWCGHIHSEPQGGFHPLGDLKSTDFDFRRLLDLEPLRCIHAACRGGW